MCAHFLNRLPAPRWNATHLFFLAGWWGLRWLWRRSDADRLERLLQHCVWGALLALFCVTFHRPDGTLRARLYLLAGRGTLYRRHGNTDQYQRVLESGICGALAFCPCPVISSIAPMEPLTLLPLLAGWWWPRNLRDGKYGWLQHLQ